MNPDNHAQIMLALGALKAQVVSFGERFDRMENSRDRHQKTIYRRLENLEASKNINKARFAMIGAFVLLIGATLAVGIGAIVSHWLSRG